jgi:hypothetical protein
MSVQDITEMWSRHGATVTSAKATPSDSVIAYTAAYQVTVSDPINDDPAVVRQSGITPKIGDYYGGDNRYRAKSITVSRLSPIFYQIEVGYEGLEDPEISRPSLSWSSVATDEEIDRDIYGRPLMMATGEPVTGITRDISDQQLTITRRFETFDASFWSEYINWTVNADSFAGFPPGTGRLRAVSAQNAFSSDDADDPGFWNVTATFLFRRGYLVDDEFAWYARYRHEGFYQFISTSVPLPTPIDSDEPLPTITYKSLVPILDGTGQKKSTPTLLKADGTVESDPNLAVFMLRPLYFPKSYSALGLL